MLRSMTAFARTEQNYDFGTLTWELRSVNHRFLDMNLRLPEDLRGLEQGVRETINSKLKRGKVDANLRYKISADVEAVPIEIDEAFIASLLKASNKISKQIKVAVTTDPLGILRWPGAIREQERDWTPVEQAAKQQLAVTLDQLISTRDREGQRTADMLLQRCDGITELVADVRKRRPEVLQYIRAKAEAKIADLQVQVDQNRFEQELVMIAQRMDVDEELDRLDAHIAETKDVLTQGGAVGRRLDFLMQEFNREANTLSSKSADAATTKAAVDIKVLIEQMREQVQNIE